MIRIQPAYLLPFLRNTLSGHYLPNVATQFVIVYLPRTGSNYLATLLDSHPEILCHHEVFNPTGIHRSLSYKHTSLSFGTVEDRDRDPWGFMHRVYAFTDTARAVGFKLGPGGIYNWPLLSLLLSRRVRKIILERRGWLHAYTSTLIARATQVWSRTRGNDGEASDDRLKVRVDLDDFRRFLRKRRLFYSLTRTLLGVTGQPFLSLAYEDIGDPKTMTALLRFLSVDPTVVLSARTEKQNSPRLEDRVANYEELRAALAGTSQSWMLESEQA